MRILQVHNRHREAGGEDVAVADQRALLVGAGHRVTTFVVDNPPSAAAAARALAAAPWNGRAARHAAAAVTRDRPDVVHVHNTWFALSPAVVPALAATGVPVVVTWHSFRAVCANALLLRDGRRCDDCVGRAPWPAVVHRCYRGSLALSAVAAAAVALPQRAGTWRDHVARFCVPHPVAAEVLGRGGIPAERIAVVPNFAPDPGPPTRPPSAGDEVVYAGRLSEEKGVDVLVEAWRAAPPPGLALTVCGTGPLEASLRRAAPPGVRLVGHLPRHAVAGLLAGARGVAFLSRAAEVGPLVPLEAAAAGRPLVLGDAVAVAADAVAAGAGWTAPSGDPAATAEALGRLADPAAADAAGRAARRLYEEGHRPERALEALLAVYEAAVASGDAR